MRTLVIGAGAVGGYFGACLQRAGRDVTFLVRQKRADQLRRTGLQIFSPLGDFQIEPKLLTAEELKSEPQTFELILLSTKAYSLEAAMEDFAPAVGPGTAILPVLNGMRHLDMLAARFGAEHVLGGSTRIVADLDSEGRVHVLERHHDLVFGEINREMTPRIQAIFAELHGAGFDDMLSPDILTGMWQKWVLLSSMASITCLMRGTVGQVAHAPGGAETALAIIAEGASIARAEGFELAPTFIENISKRLTQTDSTLTASMYRDLHKGAPVESDQIVGDLIARAKKHGLETPLLRATFAQLSVYMQSL
ncbi:MAG TPA: ketopantoate reductase family protein [Acidobacteriaceae bacterium]|jgi:2-dehydropantoate 2-reductase